MADANEQISKLLKLKKKILKTHCNVTKKDLEQEGIYLCENDVIEYFNKEFCIDLSCSILLFGGAALTYFIGNNIGNMNGVCEKWLALPYTAASFWMAVSAANNLEVRNELTYSLKQ